MDLADRMAGRPFPLTELESGAGAAARNAGDPSSYPARDIDGQARFLGTRPDAGADEAG